MAHLNQSGTDQRTPVRKLTICNKCHNLIIVILSLKLQVKTSPSSTMPKAKQKSVAEDVEEETPLHGVINEEEAKTYRDGLDTIFDNLAKNIQDNIGNAMELAAIDLTAHITNHIPSVAEVDPKGLLNTIHDPSCLILREQTEEVREKLEEIILESDIPRGKDIMQDIEDMGTLNEQQKNDIGEVFDNLEIAHEYLGQSCGLMAGLS